MIKRGIALFFWVTLFYAHAISGQVPKKCLFKSNADKNGITASQRILDNGDVVVISVVVHVVYNSDIQNISDDQIRSQLVVLNEDFNKANADTINTVAAFRLFAGNPKIIFALATKDAGNNPTTGITRTNTTHSVFFNDDIHFTNLGGKDSWPSKFLNIWICDLPEGSFGYGTPPGTSPLVDGVVIDYKYFGTSGTVSVPYDKGRTTTHEIGHWLGLKHLWGDLGGCSDDDGISDTPPQYGPSSGCTLNRVSCSNLNMVQNFMDESDDACMTLFTKGQVELMRNNLFTNRADAIADVITAIKKEPLDIKLVKTNWNSYLLKSNQPIEDVEVFNSIGQVVQVAINQSSEANELSITFSGNGLFIFVAFSKQDRYVTKILQ